MATADERADLRGDTQFAFDHRVDLLRGHPGLLG
jgi:hypothetical protein